MNNNGTDLARHPVLSEKHLSVFTVKPVLSDHIKQYIFLAFQTGGCLLLHENSTESSCMSFSALLSFNSN